MQQGISKHTDFGKEDKVDAISVGMICVVSFSSTTREKR
jgi:hypothetical protein